MKMINLHRSALLPLGAWFCISVSSCAHLLERGGGPFNHAIDPMITPAQPSLSGNNGGPPRPIAVVVGPTGERIEFIADELVVKPRDAQALQGFLARTGGVIVHDGAPPEAIGLPPPKAAASSGWVLVRIDAQKSTLEDLDSNLSARGLSGRHAFSSEAGARLLAAAAREKHSDFAVGPNYVAHPYDFVVENNIQEAPDGMGGFVNAAQFGYMTDTLDLNNGLMGIGVIRAWDYLRYKGIPFGKPWQVPMVAIVDGGFAVDAAGKPLNNNTDFINGQTPPQFDVNNAAKAVNAPSPNQCGSAFKSFPCPFHGMQAFSIAAATPRNRFGTAGSGAEVVRPLLIQAALTSFDIGTAVRGAALYGAAVISMSFGSSCLGQICGYFTDAWWQLQENINFARGWGNAIPIAAAGNNSETDNNQYDNVPCTLDGVLCVGAVDMQANREQFGGTQSGAGKRVAIWAPDKLYSTPTPQSLAAMPGAVGLASLPQFGGTSSATPFVAGIVGLMKALDPSLTVERAIQILQSTALRSAHPDVTPGYVNALAAVQAVSPNLRPTIQITQPANGAQLLWGRQVSFSSSISDPEQDPKMDGVKVLWVSNKDGMLCEGVACDAKKLSFGKHTITATVTDPYASAASQSISLDAISQPPSATISYPPDGSTIFASQKLNLRGAGSSPNEQILPSQLSWSTSAAGALGTGADTWVQLSQGNQAITLTVTDSLGQKATASIAVNVLAGQDVPTAQIVSPKDGDTFGVDGNVTLVGQGSDPVDGALSGSALSLSSNIDGALGTGSPLKVKLTSGACAPVVHKITLTATNKAGKSATHVITLSVGTIC